MLVSVQWNVARAREGVKERDQRVGSGERNVLLHWHSRRHENGSCTR